MLVKTEEELHYANNFLPIGPRYIMAVGNQSQDLQDAVAAHGVGVGRISLEILCCQIVAKIRVRSKRKTLTT